MPDRDWTTVKHFRREEFVNDPDRVSWDTVMLLDNMRDDAQAPFKIHVAWDDSGHVNDSSHYTEVKDFCTAVDFHVVGMSLLDQWLFAERYPWNGIGVYPYWENPGLHCDLRRLGREHPNLGKRWWRDAHGIYKSFDKEMVSIIMLMGAK